MAAAKKATPGSKPEAVKAAPTKVSAAPKNSPTPTSPAAPEPPKKASPPAAKKAPAVKAQENMVTPKKAPAPAAAPKKPVQSGPDLPPVKGVTKDGISYTKDFDAKWLTAQYELLLEERIALTGQASRLEDEANQIIEESEMGDVQFDDEGGEGDTMVVERERDLALSAQARNTIEEIDEALERIMIGSYGYSVESGRPISRERLEAIPWASVLVEEKVGGIGRR